MTDTTSEYPHANANKENATLRVSSLKRKRKDPSSPGTQQDDMQGEINDFYKWFPSLKNDYEILTKIGEGTFSTVYKAKDLRFRRYQNDDWIRLATFTTGQNSCTNGKNNDTDEIDDRGGNKKNIGGVERAVAYPYVAIKRIYHTSSPERMVNEIAVLRDLRGSDHVVPLITAERYEDQLICVLPFFEHEDFRDYFHTLSLDEIQDYCRELFKALAHVHSKRILHRDVKPSNFLYSRLKRRGLLADFGLAQREEKPALPRKRKIDSHIEAQLIAARGRPGFLAHDTRPTAKANRAGTRGFRAPEVLFKVAHQTTAIDIWSVGVIMISLFTGLFPFFQSNDDGEALIELGNLFGKKALKEVAATFNRTFDTNIPDIGPRQDLKKLCLSLRYTIATNISDEGYDLLERCFDLNPTTRITADEALSHPFLREYSFESET
ncbi:hypothetical protein SeMB42_g06135 [Synchytrium endobioticum]|uniref:non-specific serine/threonine protein kinase n=1 Tax=Synchytrium endobioticum TaxID=286115 RepID=A0A507CSF5_9FUNG|nr:hypothetical protein SeMB42_g06135 [Synchytrium endobioticum]TPX42083.1 hypothetical protein SeLEV6574_g05770 [Synchytrium endobioticum]